MNKLYETPIMVSVARGLVVITIAKDSLII